MQEAIGSEIHETQQSDLREYLQVLRRRKEVVALTVVVCVALALAYSFVKKPVYTASAQVLVPSQQVSSALNPQNSQLPASASLQRSLADEQHFAQGDATRKAAKSILGFSAHASVGASAAADVLTFKASSGSKAQAAAIANAFANGYISARRDNQVAQYTQQVVAIENSISDLQARANKLSPGSQLSALEQSITALTQTFQQLQAASQLAIQSGPAVVQAATPPSSPSSPKPIRNGLLGFMIGLVLGVLLAFLVERLDDGIKSQQDAQNATRGLPVIGLIPIVPAWRAKTTGHLALVEDPTSQHAEAYRTLRTAIQFLGIDEPRHVYGITSSVPDEGKTTTVANLAVSFARAGQRVIVVSCDLRRPKLHAFFGDTGRTGLTSVLLGDASLNDAIHPVENEPRLRVVPSGPLAPNPAEILSLDRVRQVVDVLAENSDIVLLDCPPVLPVTDALLLSRLVDGMLIVTSAKTTSKRDLRRSFDLLSQVQAPVLGTIINRVPIDGGAAYGYGYGYYDYRYDYSPDPHGNGARSSGEAANAQAATGPIAEAVGHNSLSADPDERPVPGASRLARRGVRMNGQSATAPRVDGLPERPQE